MSAVFEPHPVRGHSDTVERLQVVMNDKLGPMEAPSKGAEEGAGLEDESFVGVVTDNQQHDRPTRQVRSTGWMPPDCSPMRSVCVTLRPACALSSNVADVIREPDELESAIGRG